MEKTENMPIWVYLAFSSIRTRKAALYLIWACAAFAVYCIPWPLFTGSENSFLVNDWSWFAMMVPMTLWYTASLRWVDRNSGWPDADEAEDQLLERVSDEDL